MEYKIIVALDENNVIADSEKGIPWDVPQDYKHYKSVVEDKLTISGRKTFEAIPRYEGRRQIVLTNNRTWVSDYDNVSVSHSIDEAKDIAEKKPESCAYILGGEGVYREFLPDTNEMIISHIEGQYEGDVYFPKFNRDEWTVTKEKQYDDFVVRRYVRRDTV